MNPGYVENEDEYRVSKFYLIQFICSQPVLDAADRKIDMIMTVLRFLQSNVFIHENLYLHYMRKHIRHFNTAHSCAHEGTNLGLKAHSAAMKATMTLTISSQTLATQSQIHAKKLDEIVYRDYIMRNKLWSMSPTRSLTTSFGEGLIQAVYKQKNYYTCQRVGKRLFEVKYNGSQDVVRDEKKGDTESELDKCNVETVNGIKPFEGTLPKFSRIRRIVIDTNGIMYCSCCKFESTGIFCVHQVITAEKVYAELGEDFHGLVHTSRHFSSL